MSHSLLLLIYLLSASLPQMHGQTCTAHDPGPRIPKTAAEVLRRYSAMSRKMLAGPPEQMRFIGHGAVHNAGLGNQIQAMISALMLGILTNRAFLVDWPKVDAHGIVYAGAGRSLEVFPHAEPSLLRYPGNNATEQAGLPAVNDLLHPPFKWDFWEAINRIPEE